MPFSATGQSHCTPHSRDVLASRVDAWHRLGLAEQWAYATGAPVLTGTSASCAWLGNSVFTSRARFGERWVGGSSAQARARATTPAARSVTAGPRAQPPTCHGHGPRPRQGRGSGGRGGQGIVHAGRDEAGAATQDGTAPLPRIDPHARPHRREPGTPIPCAGSYSGIHRIGKGCGAGQRGGVRELRGRGRALQFRAGVPRLEWVSAGECTAWRDRGERAAQYPSRTRSGQAVRVCRRGERTAVGSADCSALFTQMVQRGKQIDHVDHLP